MFTAQDLGEIELIKRLKYRYCRLLDQKRFDELGELFLAEATASYGGGARELSGRDEIVGWLREAMSSTSMLTSHQVSQPEIDLVRPDPETGATEATGIWALQDVVVLADAGLTIRGASYYDDRYEKVDGGGWQIRHTGYRRLYEEMQPRSADTTLTASWWTTDGRSSLV